MRRLILPCILLLSLLSGLSLRAQERPVDLQLILAVDASGSIDNDEWALQIQGYVDALNDPEVLRAIETGGPEQAIALTFVQWSGYALQFQVIPWRRIAGKADAQRFAEDVKRSGRQIFGGGTSLSGIIDYALPLFAQCAFPSRRKVLDISGDGVNRNSRPSALARDEAVAAGIVINGLPILGSEADLDKWYEGNVIGGPGAFMIAAEDFMTFGRAIRQKLIREIAGRPRDVAKVDDGR